ncbi:MAG: DUF4364 family protein [Candidatus Bathyarchaeota archaeon]|nr:MAG: DUF4364 family protein [Candidatus Bathyarchaeota archaeon]
MYRRSRLDIYFDILEVIQRGTQRPTRIMYKTNLSWTTLQEMFKTLIERGFIQIETEGKTKVYSVTEKGKRALSYHQKSLEGLIKPEGSLRSPLFVNV